MPSYITKNLKIWSIVSWVGYFEGNNMTLSYINELILRSATTTNNRNLTNQVDSSNLTKTLEEKVKQSAANSSDKEKTAISLAIAGLAVAYNAITTQMGVLKNQRVGFDKERQAGIATFLVSTSTEESLLSKKETFMKEFMALTHCYPSFEPYLGIYSADLEDGDVKFYSTVPFYKMSEHSFQKESRKNRLDHQRSLINLFCKYETPHAIGVIDADFQKHSTFIEFWKSLAKKKKYLNHLRAPRFVIMSLSNLLWHLQYPIDPVTGFPCTLTQCITMCCEVEAFLNQLLRTNSPPYLKNIHKSKNDLIRFVLSIEMHTKALRMAYIEQQLNELNIKDLVNSSHSMLRSMDKYVFKLIYKRFNYVSRHDELDDKAAETIAETISSMNLILMSNPYLLNTLGPIPDWIPKASAINQTPQTTMDFLIFYCHLSTEERLDLIAKIQKKSAESAALLAKTLRKFDQRFLNPIERVSKKELKATFLSPKNRAVCYLTARRILPFLTLVIKDFQVPINSTCMDKFNAKSGIEQLKAISESAQSDSGYYIWDLSPFIPTSERIKDEIAELPRRQYRMTQITELLDGIAFIVENYQSFLQNKSFQSFLLTSFAHIKEEYTALDLHMKKIDAHLWEGEGINRSLQTTLALMTGEISKRLETFELATRQVEQFVSAPDFTQHQRDMLDIKLGDVSAKFSTLFHNESGIESLIRSPTITPRSSKKSQQIDAYSQIKKVNALKILILNCSNALSYQSRNGHKGKLLGDLLKLMDKKSDVTDNEIRDIIMNLTRLTASYRQTWFFQASYGETRSSRALCEAIKNPCINESLPLAAIIFDQPHINCMTLKDEDILKRIKHLQEGNHWQLASENILNIMH